MTHEFRIKKVERDNGSYMSSPTKTLSRSLTNIKKKGPRLKEITASNTYRETL